MYQKTFECIIFVIQMIKRGKATSLLREKCTVFQIKQKKPYFLYYDTVNKKIKTCTRQQKGLFNDTAHFTFWGEIRLNIFEVNNYQCKCNLPLQFYAALSKLSLSFTLSLSLSFFFIEFYSLSKYKYKKSCSLRTIDFGALC